jgi:hypothetical protein
MRLTCILLFLIALVSSARAEAPAELFETPKLPVIAAPASEELDAALDRGIGYLLEKQNADGSWGSARRTKGLNIYAPVPGAHQAFRAAVTSLCLSALCEAERFAERKDERITHSIDRGQA